MMCGVRPAVEILALVIAVALVAGAARRAGLSPPLVLVVVGVVASLVPGVPDYRLDPDVVLIGAAAPLLYAAAMRTSLVDVRANRQAIGILAVGAVVFTTVVVGVVAWLLLPTVSLAAGLALGAIVAPPDAVAATTIAPPGRHAAAARVDPRGREPAQRRDGAGRAAHGDRGDHGKHRRVGWCSATSCSRSVGGVVGRASRALPCWPAIRKRVSDPVLDTTLSFIAPFLAYLPAEAIHASGVLAVVVTGLILGHKSPILQSASSRLSEQTNWRTVQFVLENAVFLIIGLQVPDTIRAAWDSEVGHDRVVLLCVAVLAGDHRRPGRVGLRRDGDLPVRPAAAARRTPGPGRTRPLVSWAGMRGVVTLAAAFAAARARHRRATALVLAALTVVAGTLLLQGTDAALADPAARICRARRRGGRAAGGRVAVQRRRAPAWPGSRSCAATRTTRRCIDRLEQRVAVPRRLGMGAARARQHVGRDTERDLPAAAAGDARRRATDRAGRARTRGTADDEVLRDVLGMLDVEESLLDRLDDKESRSSASCTARSEGKELCAHLDERPRRGDVPTPLRAARSACATARTGCTCGCA